MSDLLHTIIPAETILSLFQVDTQMFIFFNALAKRSKILIFKMDIFTNVLRKIFVKGSMHLIYERNLIPFHNPFFPAVYY